MDPYALSSPPSPPINPACVPGKCSGLPRTSVSSARVQKVLQEYFSAIRIPVILRSILQKNISLINVIAEFARLVGNSQLGSKENRLEFRTKIISELDRSWKHFDEQGYRATEITLLPALSTTVRELVGGTCYCTLSQPESLRRLEKGARIEESVESIAIKLFLHDKNSIQDSVSSWDHKNKIEFSHGIAALLLGILEGMIKSSQTERILFTFLDSRVGALDLLHYGDICNDLLDVFELSTLEMDSKVLKFNSVAFTCTNAMEVLKGTPALVLERLTVLKAAADQFAAEENYAGALRTYTVVNILRGPDSCKSLLVQSLANSAALGLRLASDNSFHLPNVILDCTLALEIEPNYVKALFRRGLALALSKKWNEAIIDFERAVELDPRSPAVKELAVARRQVTRRIGA